MPTVSIIGLTISERDPVAAAVLNVQDKSSTLDADEFLALCDVLITRLSVRHVTAAQEQLLRVPGVQRMVEDKRFDWLCYVLILANLCIVIVQVCLRSGKWNGEGSCSF